jgi:hypothetical protein
MKWGEKTKKKNVFSFLLLASLAQLSKPLLFAAKLKTWFTFFGENALFLSTTRVETFRFILFSDCFQTASER